MSVMRVQIGTVECEVDPEATRAAYAKMPLLPMGGCDCEDCRNFAVQASEWLRGPCFDVLEAWGVNRMKPHEICCAGERSEPRLYWLTYGVGGRVLANSRVTSDGRGGLTTPERIEFFDQFVDVDSGSPLVLRSNFRAQSFGFEVDFADVPWLDAGKR